MLVIDPGQRYRVSVFNIPKPEQNHSGYDISTDVIVPGESETIFGCCICCFKLSKLNQEKFVLITWLKLWMCVSMLVVHKFYLISA